MNGITLQEVAHLAGISASTVSRVVQGKANVAPETRERVLRAINRTGYFPNGTARAMVKKQTKTIGVSISDVSNPFYPPVLRGIENTINKFDYNMILCNTDRSKEKEEQYLRIMLEKCVDGLIIAATNSKVPFLQTFATRKIPIVCLDRAVENVETDMVGVDNVHGAFTAVEHLIKLGHKRIAIIKGIRGITTTSERLKGYSKALTRCGIDMDKSLITDGISTMDGGIEATETLLRLRLPPTAIFSSTTLITLGTYIALQRLKKKIPEDVAIIGFDDVEWIEALNPALTTVSQPTYAIGVNAGHLLMQRLLNEGPKQKQKTILGTTLTIRESC